jgi:hypothetical protein
VADRTAAEVALDDSDDPAPDAVADLLYWSVPAFLDARFRLPID